MRSNKWQLLTVFLVLALAVPLAAACGPTPVPQVVKETVVVTEKETVVVTEKQTVVVTEKEEVEVTKVVKEEVVVTATPPPEPTAVPEGFVQRGGTIRTEYNWIPYVEDPAADGVGTGLVGLSIAESLVWVNEAGIPQPQLIKSWDASADLKEWTLHLQEGVTFNNGKPFGADDVIWNILHWLDPDSGASAAAKLDMLKPEGIEKVDDLTVKLTLDRANADLLLAFYDYPTMIAPEGGWTDFYSGDPADAIGTGPFLMEEFVPDERMVLVRNPNYWRLGVDGQPLPYVDKVIVTAGWDDAARLAALVGDEADILSPGEGIIEELQKYPDQIEIQTYDRWAGPMVVRVDMKPFDDVRVRQALKLVVDREKMWELVQPLGYIGYDHWIDASDASYCPDTDADGRPQDIEKAKALLAEAGYPDGLELELAVPAGDFRTNLAQVYQEMAALAGITVKITILPSSAFWDQWQQWPFSVTGWNSRIPATANINLALRCGAAWTESYYCNEELDALLDQWDATADVAARRALNCQIQKLMQDDSPYILPIWAAQFGASQRRVHLPDTYSRGGFLWHMIWLSE
jgi:peptide/nickel transport system substrate-binding protein